MFPSILNTFNRPTPSDRLDSPSHSALHNTVSSALGQVEAFIGVEGASSTIGTLIYDVRSPGSNGGGHVQTANKGGTGQTSYNKGDVLVAQSSSVLTKILVGSDGFVLTADSSQATGIKWASGATTVTSYLSSGTWTKPSALSFIEVELWGGGGSGAAGNAGGTGGAGGGGGSYNYGRFFASQLSATESINIGAGAPSTAAGSNGTQGGNTVFGTASLITAYGGGGGVKISGANGGGGGGGGPLSKGENAVSVNGGRGGQPSQTNSITGVDNSAGGGLGGWGGVGGFSYFGGGGGAAGSGGGGTVGGNSFYGGGGGGGGGNSGGFTLGGTSKQGGNGGYGNDANGGNGSVAGGGGGGGGNGSGGAGGGGKVIVYEFA